MKLIIYGRLPGLNEYTDKCRTSWQAGARMKAQEEKKIKEAIKTQLGGLTTSGPVKINFHWYEPNSRRDLDNVCFAKKFILDALVAAGTLKGDDRKHVEGFRDFFEVDKLRPRIEVDILEDNT